MFNLARDELLEVSIDTFNFDEWASLAKAAPNDFEQQRREHIDALITRHGNSVRLRGLQCRIDLERIRSRTAMQACLRIYSLMWDSFLEYQMTLNNFVQGGSVTKDASVKPIKEAQIIRFPREN